MSQSNTQSVSVLSATATSKVMRLPSCEELELIRQATKMAVVVVYQGKSVTFSRWMGRNKIDGKNQLSFQFDGEGFPIRTILNTEFGCGKNTPLGHISTNGDIVEAYTTVIKAQLGSFDKFVKRF